MLGLMGRPFRGSDGVTRRSFLHAGALGLAGMSLGDLLRRGPWDRRRATTCR